MNLTYIWIFRYKHDLALKQSRRFWIMQPKIGFLLKPSVAVEGE